eukprot:Awhi_evm1s480
MSGGNFGVDMIQMCIDITQTKGPVKLDFGVWQHSFDTEKTHEEKQDLDTGIVSQDIYLPNFFFQTPVIIGDGSTLITLEDVLKAVNDYNSDPRIEELFYSGRSYFWEGWYRTGSDDFDIVNCRRKKKKPEALPLEWRACWGS